MCQKYTEKEIQVLLNDDFCLKKKHEVTVPNITTCHEFWEADLLSMTKSGFVHEFEIKTTRSDWSKEKRIIENMADDGCKLRRAQSLSKQFCYGEDLGISPNYFWLCAPSGVIREDEIPEYAGVIEVYEFRKKQRIKIMKNAPLLHHGKASDKMMFSMLRSMNYKYWNQKRKVA